MSPLRFASPLVAALLLSATGCALGAPDSPLANTSWRISTLDGQRPVSGSGKMDFRRSDISVSIGCNSIGGAWRVEGDRLIAGPLMQTEMACDTAIMRQEDVLAALLVATPRMTLGGDRLTLQSSAHTVELIRSGTLSR